MIADVSVLEIVSRGLWILGRKGRAIGNELTFRVEGFRLFEFELVLLLEPGLVLVLGFVIETFFSLVSL